MKVDDLPAGRKLDALIAARVFGTSRRDVWYYYESPHNKVLDSVLHYSTDIKAAWEVWTALPREWGEHGLGVTWYLIDTHFMFHPNDERHFVCKAELDCGEVKWLAEGKTAMLAICRAALKAVGITEVPD